LHALSGVGAEQSATIPDHCPVQKLELIAPKGSVTGLRLTIDGG
jgi:hypothetical protein